MKHRHYWLPPEFPNSVLQESGISGKTFRINWTEISRPQTLRPTLNIAHIFPAKFIRTHISPTFHYGMPGRTLCHRLRLGLTVGQRNSSHALLMSDNYTCQAGSYLSSPVPCPSETCFPPLPDGNNFKSRTGSLFTCSFDLSYCPPISSYKAYFICKLLHGLNGTFSLACCICWKCINKRQASGKSRTGSLGLLYHVRPRGRTLSCAFNIV